MKTKPLVRVAVVGTGNIGAAHARDAAALHNMDLIAVCDRNPHLADALAQELGVEVLYDYQALLARPDLDAVIVATPHFSHPAVVLAAFQNGVHVMVEKPIAAHINDAQAMISAYEAARIVKPDLVFGAMFMQRTYGHWSKIKDLIASGELGQLIRTTWIITDWFRAQSYYDHGKWRATWKGEGGGVLLNQSSHQLDLYQWLVGMPRRVYGLAAFGKYHAIEVEDEVTAVFEHETGMIGHFITSTAESPGTNRLEIAGENGKLIYEDGRLIFCRTRHSVFKQIREAEDGFTHVEAWRSEIPYMPGPFPGHKVMTENFADAILHGTPLIAPAPEGLNSLMLANAIIMSSMRGLPVDLPLDANAYEDVLKSLIAESKLTDRNANDL